MKEKVLVYICGIDAQHELGETDVQVFESPERLQENKRHNLCGIAEYEMKFVRWVSPQSPLAETKNNREES